MNWKDYIRVVTPYTPGEQPRISDIIKLNTNENPYPPAPGVEKALREFPSEVLRKYPDPDSLKLKNAIASYYGVQREQVFTGVGSDDVLALCFLTFFNGREPVIFPDVTYSFYDVWANLFRISFETIPVREDLSIRPDDYIRDNGGIIFPNPNAPTGLALDTGDIERIVRSNPESVVIVDEAYVDFGAESALPLVNRYDNLLVVRTFSKSRSLAGLRIGFAIGSREEIAALEAVRNSFNSYPMSALAIELGTVAIADEDYFKKTCAEIMDTREWSKEKFRKYGFRCGDSKANFLFVTHPEINAAGLFEDLKKKKLFVRYFEGERTKDYLRVTIGTREQMDRFFGILEDWMKEKGLYNG